MEAVIATGGKQYRVTTGQVIAVERLAGDKGAKVEFASVLLVNKDGEIIAGHGRVEAAKLLGLESVPTLRLSHLDAAQRRAYDREQKRCQRKYAHEDGTMYRSFEAFCGADVARNYSAKFLKTVPASRI